MNRILTEVMLMTVDEVAPKLSMVFPPATQRAFRVMSGLTSNTQKHLTFCDPLGVCSPWASTRRAGSSFLPIPVV